MINLMINFPKISFDFLRGSWRYDPSIDEKRDFRLDFLRGIAIVFMVVNHLESRSYFNNVNVFYTQNMLHRKKLKLQLKEYISRNKKQVPWG